MEEVNLELSERIIKEVKDIKDNIDLVIRAYGHEDSYCKGSVYRLDYPYKKGYLLFWRAMESRCWMVIYVNPENIGKYRDRNLVMDFKSQDMLFLSMYGRKNPIIRKGPWVHELRGLSHQAKEFIEEREEINNYVDSLVYEDTDT